MRRQGISTLDSAHDSQAGGRYKLAMPQGAWAASEGPVCPQSLTICALLVVIKVSNSEVSWGLAKRGQKMSLRCSSR
ncbi:hypothetical protein PAMP_004388 [Pampus punctatissimus]